MRQVKAPKAFAWRAVWEKLYGDISISFFEEQYRLWTSGVRDHRIHDNWFEVANMLGYGYK